MENLSQVKFASIITRNIANIIDIFISFIIAKFIILQGFWMTFGFKSAVKWQDDMVKQFSTNEIRSEKHWQFLLHHQFFFSIVIMVLLFVIIGTLYHSLLNSSKWQGTIGKKIMKIKIVKSTDFTRISFKQAICHYFISLTPWFIGIYFLIYQIYYKIENPMLLISESWFNLVLLTTIGFWLQYQIFSKSKAGFNDLICKTAIIKVK